MKTFVLAWFGIITGLWSMELSSVRGIKIEWGDWGKWTQCDVTCGGGVKSKTKRCTTPGIGDEKCIKTREKKCNMQPCRELDSSPFGEPPVKPEKLPMAEYPPPFAEIGVPELMPETERTFSYGEPTPGPESRPKKEIKVKWGDWEEWGRCNVTCGGGIKTRRKRCTTPGIGEKKCTKTKQRKCNVKPCRKPDYPSGEPTAGPEPMSTKASTLSPWEGPIIIGEPTVGTAYLLPFGEPPSGPEPMPEGPEMTEWSQWTTCNALCEGGVRFRTRECVYPDGKSDCEDAQSEACNTFPCLGFSRPTPEGYPEAEPTPEPEQTGPEMTEWSQWTTCDALCEGGIRYRTRECVYPDEKSACEDAQSEPCNTFPCLGFGRPTPEGSPEAEPTPEPEQTGPEMTEWSQWTACDVLCEGGVRYRTRECVYPNEKSACEDAQSEPCNTFPCLGFGRPTPEGYPEAELTPVPEQTDAASPEGEPTQSSIMKTTTSTSDTSNVTVQTSRYASTTVYYVTSMSDKELRKRKKEMKRICGRSKIRTSSYITQTAVSPGYPNSYSGNLECIWTLISPKRTRVSIQVEDFTMSEGDKLTLIEGRHGEMTYSDSNIIATLHGNVTKGTEYRSISRFMTLRLRTESGNGGGRYSFKFGTITAKHDEDVKNSETAPEVETWVKLMRILMKHFSDKM